MQLPRITQRELLEMVLAYPNDMMLTPVEEDLAILDLAREVLDPFELEDVYNRTLGYWVERGTTSGGSYEPGDYTAAIKEVLEKGITEPYLEDQSAVPFYNRKG